MKFVVRYVTVSLLVMLSACASTQTEKVALKGGVTYEVETVRGLPVRFANDQIRVRDLGKSDLLALDKIEPVLSEWTLSAELMGKGQFAVTVTTPLDKSASATFEVAGPGKIDLSFFPRAKYPLIWEGIDQPGIHWFPFHFVFEGKQSKKRFEFTQWTQIDSATMEQERAMHEEMMKKYKKQ